MTGPHYVLVLTGPAGRRFGIRVEPTPGGVEFAQTRGPVVVDVDAGTEIGEAAATCHPMLVEIAGVQHVLFAGTADSPAQRFTAVEGRLHPVRQSDSVVGGVWMAFPEPFTPGRVVTVAGLDAEQRELFRLTSPPLDARSLRPMFGPAWTTYAPLDDPG